MPLFIGETVPVSQEDLTFEREQHCATEPPPILGAHPRHWQNCLGSLVCKATKCKHHRLKVALARSVD